MRNTIFLVLLMLFLVGCKSNTIESENVKSSMTLSQESVTISTVGIESGPSVTLTKEEINFHYICSGVYDIKMLYKRLGVKQDTPYTYWERITEKSLYSLSSEIGLELPADAENIDFENNNVIISYGRKIADIELKSTNRYGGIYYIATVTYAEEYEGATVFVYSHKSLNIFSLESPCYIMKGDERIFFIDDKFEANQYE